MQELDLIRRERKASGDRRERQNDVSLDQQPNETLRCRSLGIGPEVIFGKARAWPKPVFEIVDSELSGVATGHRPEMRGHGKSQLMGLIDNRSQRVPRDLLVSLEGCEAFSGPVANGAARIFGIADDLVSDKAAPVAIEEGAGQMHFRPRHLSCFYTPFQIQFDIRMFCAGRSNR